MLPVTYPALLSDASGETLDPKRWKTSGYPRFKGRLAEFNVLVAFEYI